MKKPIATIAIATALAVGGAIGTSAGTAGGGCQVTGGGMPVNSCTTPPPLPVCAVSNVLRPHVCTDSDKLRGGIDYTLVTTTP